MQIKHRSTGVQLDREARDPLREVANYLLTFLDTTLQPLDPSYTVRNVLFHAYT